MKPEPLTPERARKILKGYEPKWYRDVQLKKDAENSERGKEYYENRD